MNSTADAYQLGVVAERLAEVTRSLDTHIAAAGARIAEPRIAAVEAAAAGRYAQLQSQADVDRRRADGSQAELRRQLDRQLQTVTRLRWVARYLPAPLRLLVLGAGHGAAGDQPDTDFIQAADDAAERAGATPYRGGSHPAGEGLTVTPLPVDLRDLDAGVVVLIGPAGSGKSTWAAANYRPERIVSLDRLRGIVADDECSQDPDVTADAVALMHQILDRRLGRRLVTVIDATNGVPAERAQLVAGARRHQLPAVAVVVGTPLDVCLTRQAARPGPPFGRQWGRAVPPSVVRNQHARTAASTDQALAAEGFAAAWHVSGAVTT